MAANKGSGNETTRRGFLAACGVGAAVLAVPAGALAGVPGLGGGAPLDALRGWYKRELERLAEELRPRFEAGELRANREADFNDPRDPDPDLHTLPMGRLERAAAERFGLTVKMTKRHAQWEGDASAAYLVLAMSPHAATTDNGYNHPGYQAQEAAAWDLIAIARARGWYTPAADELDS